MNKPVATFHKVNIDDVFEEYYDPIKREERRIKEQREERFNNKRKESGL